jgi:hypothetical protein
VLHPVRAAVPGRFGQRPAVDVFQFAEQPVHHVGARLPGLPPGEASGYLGEQVRQQRRPALVTGYRGSSGCRVNVVFHKPIMNAAAAQYHEGI